MLLVTSCIAGGLCMVPSPIHLAWSTHQMSQQQMWNLSPCLRRLRGRSTGGPHTPLSHSRTHPSKTFLTFKQHFHFAIIFHSVVGIGISLKKFLNSFVIFFSPAKIFFVKSTFNVMMLIMLVHFTFLDCILNLSISVYVKFCYNRV